MDFGALEEKNRKRTELLILIVGTIYAGNMFLSLVRHDGFLFMSLAVLAMIITTWVIYGCRFHSYVFRCIYFMVVFWSTLLLYALAVSNPYELVSYVALLVILASLTGVPAVIRLCYFTVFIGVIEEVLLGRFPPLQDTVEVIKVCLSLLNIIVIISFLYFMVNLRHSRMVGISQTMQELEGAKKSKDDFMSNVSHELRTPVNTILGLCEVIAESDDLGAIHENANDISAAGRKLMFSISDIIDFSELQSGRIELVEEEYNVSSMIHDIIVLSRSRKKNKNIEIIVDCSSTIPVGLLGDEKKIRRIVTNLMDNAIKFTDAGYVSLRIDFREEEYGGNLIFDIKDTGIGIASKDMDKIFTLFSQVDATRTRKNEGLGLGLAISRAMVNEMGGVINIDSEVTRGTTVRVVIPQKIADRKPIVQVKERKNCNLAIYLNLEKFDEISVRDEYARVIRHMVKTLNVKSYICRDIDELRRVTQKETLSHVFLSVKAYEEDRDFFEGLPNETHVLMLYDADELPEELHTRVYRIQKPLSLLPVVRALNGEYSKDLTISSMVREKFVAPDARILVVDDNRMNLEVISEILKDYQIDAVLAQSGPEAIEMMKDRAFDFVFMDHMMPGMDGIETLHHIRELESREAKEVPVVVLTANEVVGAREMFLSEGFTDFISKPIEISSLERMLRRYVASEKIQVVRDTTEKEDAEEPKESKESKTGLKLKNVDTEKGIYYCGGLERYQKILKRYYEESGQIRKQLCDLYAAENWKDYTIQVHGIKGTMVSYGAANVAEIARSLEMAGKQEDIAFIRENQDKLLEAFDAFIKNVGEQDFVCGEKREKPREAIYTEELSPEHFDELQMQLESALFDLNGERIIKILNELKKYSYLGTILEEKIDPIIEKAEMSDYISAEEAVGNIRRAIEAGR